MCLYQQELSDMTETEKPNQPEDVTLTEALAQPKVTSAPNVPPVVVKSAGKGLSIVAILFSLIALVVTSLSLYKSEILGRDVWAIPSPVFRAPKVMSFLRSN
jgi:hypothetical protein